MMHKYKKNWSLTSLLDASEYHRYSREVQSILNGRSDYFPNLEANEEPDEDMKYIISPESTWKLLWDLVGFFIILYQAIVIPFSIAFSISSPNSMYLSLDFYFFLYFVSDILLCFNTSYYSNGDKIQSRRDIIKNYLKLWFWVDIIATFPYDILYEDDTSSPHSLGSVPQLLRILKFYRLLRLLRLAKLRKILSQIEDYMNSEFLTNFLIIFRLVIFAFFITHWIACSWYYISLIESEDYPLTWLSTAHFETGTTSEIYVTALYWAFTTMATVGYGDIVPITKNEMIFAFIALIVSCAMFAYTVGSIGVLVSRYTQDERNYREKCVAINAFMKYNNIPLDLRFRTRRYLEYTWEQFKLKNIGEAEILQLLSDAIKDEVFVYTRGSVLATCVVFEKFSQNFEQQLCKILQVSTFAPSDIIFDQGEKSSHMYLIRTGEVELFQNTTGTVIKVLKSSKYFGEIALFCNTPRCCSAKSSDFLEALSLDRKDLQLLLEKNPESLRLFEYIQSRLADGDLSALNVYCYLCAELGHVATKCRKFHLLMNDEQSKTKWVKSRSRLTRLVNPYMPCTRPQKSRKANLKKYSISNVIGVESYSHRAFRNHRLLSEKVAIFDGDLTETPERKDARTLSQDPLASPNPHQTKSYSLSYQ